LVLLKHPWRPLHKETSAREEAAVNRPETYIAALCFLEMQALGFWYAGGLG
jgi:hypothetical protein